MRGDQMTGPLNTDDAKAAMLRRILIIFVVFFVVLVVLLFVPAGDIRWKEGWLFLFVYLFQGVLVWRTNPEVIVARSKFIRQGTKHWDKVLACFLVPPLVAIFPVAGVDWRFQWSCPPIWLIIVGYVLFSLGMAGITWATSVNKFAEAGVRIQAERGHRAVDTGPYAIVRHPIYVAAFFLFVGMALALGSFWAAVPAIFGYLILIVRTALEDRMLQEELEGYREYARRVRYRLIPGVW
jgi:protein-S-isoprenylcysteine O-methyltransferase Ste14